MTKKPQDLDINFDDLTNFDELDRLTTPAIQSLGLTVAIRHGNRYLMKDLAHLTDNEMMDWIQQVFPILRKEELHIEDFRTRHQRAQAFDQILDFYSKPLFPKPESLTSKTNKG
jgi:hypothetical protein